MDYDKISAEFNSTCRLMTIYEIVKIKKIVDKYLQLSENTNSKDLISDMMCYTSSKDVKDVYLVEWIKEYLENKLNVDVSLNMVGKCIKDLRILKINKYTSSHGLKPLFFAEIKDENLKAFLDYKKYKEKFVLRKSKKVKQ